MDVAALVVAILAAAVATGSLAWQIFLWRYRARLRISVGLEEVESQLQGSSRAFETVFYVTVSNRSAFGVKVIAATLVRAGTAVGAYEEMSPIDIRPQDAEVVKLPASPAFDRLVPGTPIEAWVQLATGEELRSEPIIRSGEVAG